MNDIHIRAIRYAVSVHQEVNETYDGVPYSLHLAMAAHFADRFSYLLPPEERADTLAAVWLHDIIEDCRRSYNDLKEAFTEKVAELVFAVTNDRGRTRQERAGENYYRGIVATPYATYVKLCDRLANVQYSVTMGDERMVGVYRAELDAFLEHLSPAQETDYTPMKQALRDILE